MMKRFLGILIVTSGSGSIAMAACNTAGGSFFPNQNDTVTYYSKTDNARCGHGYNAGGGTFFKSADIIRKPANGTLTKTGEFRFVYAAKPSFKGKDAYTIRVCGNSQGRDGCSTLNYDMTVQ